jgi:hypothetical protein
LLRKLEQELTKTFVDHIASNSKASKEITTTIKRKIHRKGEKSL